MKSNRKGRKDDAKSTGDGFFRGLHAFFVEVGVSRKRLQIWQRKFEDLGGSVRSEKLNVEKDQRILVLAAHDAAITRALNGGRISDCSNLSFVHFDWIEECLKLGKLLSVEPYALLTRKTLITEDEGGSKTLEPVPATCEPPLPDNMGEREVGFLAIKGSEKAEEIGEVSTANGEDEDPYYNKHLSEPLKKLSEIYSDVLADEWRALTYRKVANKLDKLPYTVSNANELKSIQGVGKSMIDKVHEILTTGQLKKLISLGAMEQVQTIQLFASVWGIGPKVARKLYQAGHRSLEEVSKSETLSSLARFGLKYHQDISQRIPCAEVTAAGTFIREVLQDLCSGALMTVGGSYRRGLPTCGDIDILVTHPDGQSHVGLLGRLVNRLQELDFLVVCPRSSSEPSSSSIVDTYMSVCKVPGYTLYRRIDIKIYPNHAYSFALVYFTGNDVLNRRIRYLARTKGFKLNDQGLYPRVGYGQNAVASDICVPCATEKDIFEKLGLPYPEPHDRNW